MRRPSNSGVRAAARWRCVDCSRCIASIRAPRFSRRSGSQPSGLFDLDRLERLTLRVIAKDYFRLPLDAEESES